MRVGNAWTGGERKADQRSAIASSGPTDSTDSLSDGTECRRRKTMSLFLFSCISIPAME